MSASASASDASASSIHMLSPVLAIIIHTAIATMLIPLLIALFLFSTPQMRRGPTFIAIVISVLLSITTTVISLYYVTVQVLDPLNLGRINNIIPTLGITGNLPTFAVDIALLLRMLAVYPLNATSKPKFFAIFTPTILLKIACVCTWIVWEVHEPKDVASQVVERYILLQRKMILTSNVLTAIDNAYTSCIFLWKIRGIFTHFSDTGRITDGSRDSLGNRIRTLFWAATTCFVFPVPLFIAAAVLAIQGRDNTLDFQLVESFSTFVAVIFAAFATVWSSSLTTRENFVAQASPSCRCQCTSETQSLSALRFRRAESCSTDIELSGSSVKEDVILSKVETPVQVGLSWESK